MGIDRARNLCLSQEKLITLTNLTPYITLSLKGEGEDRERGGRVPLRHLFFYLLEGEEVRDFREE